MKRFPRLLTLVTVLLALLSFTALAAPFASAAQYDGVNVHSLWDSETTAQMNAELDISASAHVNVLRVDVSWAGLEGDGPGQFNGERVARLDAFIQGAAARGIKVLPTVIQTPCWASSAPASQTQGCQGAWWERNVTNYAPSSPSTYGGFMQWLTSRYGTELAGVEVWNEPNEPGNFEASNVPAAYAALLKAAYTGAKAGNLSVPVIAGAIAGADASWLEALYAHGIRGYYDGFSVHTYPGANGPYWSEGNAGCSCAVMAGVEAFHAVQVANGDTTPLWVTEFGWQTQAGLYSAVSEQQQATFITQAFQGLQSLPYVRAAIVYDLRDGTDPGNFMDHYGLITADFQPKPALAALQAVLASPTTPDASAGAPAGTTTDSTTPGSGDASVGASGSATATGAARATSAAGAGASVGASGASTGAGRVASAAASAPSAAGAAQRSTSATGTAGTITPTSLRRRVAVTSGARPAAASLGREHGAVVVHIVSELGRLRAGNVYDASRNLYRVALWRVGGQLRLLRVPAQTQPFDMALARLGGVAKLVFSRCSAGRCRLFSAVAGPAMSVTSLSGLPAGSDFLPSISHAARLSFVSTGARGDQVCRGTLAGGRVRQLSCRAMRFFAGGASALGSASSRVVVLRHADALQPVSLGIRAA